LPGNEVLPIGKISAAAKSFYEGGCVEISLASGRKLTVTENHPILTSRGWIPAYLIDERIDSIFTGNINGIAPIVNPNNQQSPAMIEDIFTTLKESIFCSTISVPASTEDFNGDGRNIHGDVNIISANRFLGNDFNMLTDKKLSNIKLDRDSFGFSHLPSLGLLDLHEAGNLYSESRSVGGFDLMRPLDSRHSAPLDFFGFGLSARNDISFNEPLSESPAVNTYLARQFIFRFASDITVEKVVKIRNFYFSGHVYDLQCDDYGLYITNGIITHNCRCWISTRTDILGEKELQNVLAPQLSNKEYLPEIRRLNPVGTRPITDDEYKVITERIKNMPEGIRKLEPIDDKYRTYTKLSGETFVKPDEMAISVVIHPEQTGYGTAFHKAGTVSISKEFIGTPIQDHEYIHSLTWRNKILRDAIQDEYKPPFIYEHALHAGNKNGEQFTMVLTGFSEDKEKWIKDVMDTGLHEDHSTVDDALAQINAVTKLLKGIGLW